MREYHVRICEGLGVKFPGSTRHSRPSHFVPVLNNVRYASDSDHSWYESELTLWANLRLMQCSKQGAIRSPRQRQQEDFGEP